MFLAQRRKLLWRQQCRQQRQPGKQQWPQRKQHWLQLVKLPRWLLLAGQRLLPPRTHQLAARELPKRHKEQGRGTAH